MKKNNLYKNKNHFHINVDFESQPLFKELDWIFIQKKINILSEKLDISIQALVMMDTHIHLLIKSNSNKENYFCELLKIELNSEKKSEIFCEPILNYSQFLNAYKYLYRNPVEVGLSNKVENYPFSSLQIILGQSVGYFLVDDPIGLIQNPIQILNWLNSDNNFKQSQLKLVRQDISESM